MKRDLDHFYGCLIGGAIGDALGAPVEFIQYTEIIEKYGLEGINALVIPPNSKKAIITDDTQLTLFTAEGLIRSLTRSKQRKIERSIKDTIVLVFRAYSRWLYTQGLTLPHWKLKDYDGWLVKTKKLHFYRQPGITCITSLGREIMGTREKPINNSDRCGCVIRVAPVGLFENEEDVFEVAGATAAITHGHPKAYLMAGTLASIIYYIIEGKEIEEAVQKAMERLKQESQDETCGKLLEKAIALATQKEPSYEKLKMLGEGFEAEEAVAMGIYCALSYPSDLEKAVKLAANHDGDSDSVASITGNIVGAYIGGNQISEEWKETIEINKEIKQVAADLLQRYEQTTEWQVKYPGW